MGGEKLKISIGAVRVFRAALAALALFSTISIPAVFAQPSPGTALEEDSPVGEAADPIRAAEQALTLEDGGAGAAGTGTGGASSVGTVLRLLLTLALAAAAIYGVVYFIRRSSRRGEARDPFLKVLAGVPLGANRSAQVVAVGSRAWLVGCAENGVTLISEIEDKDILNAMFLEDSRKGGEAGAGRLLDFRALLGRLGLPVQAGNAPPPENIRKRRERLKGL